MSIRPISRAAYVRTHSKSMGGAALLAILLGPVGALYGSPIGAVILILVTVGTGFLGLVVTWPASIAVAMWGAAASRRRATAHYDLMADRA